METTSARMLIFMRGVVGAGKTTLAHQLAQELESRNYNVAVEGTDKYRRKQLNHVDTVQQIYKNLAGAIQGCDKDSRVAVIIDTCGEKCDPHNVFGVDFSDWKTFVLTPNFNAKDIEGYLAWSLTNVLSRESYTDNSNHYLDPVTAGVRRCVDVHARKALGLPMVVGRHAYAQFNHNHLHVPMTRHAITQSLAGPTTRYKLWLGKQNTLKAALDALF